MSNITNLEGAFYNFPVVEVVFPDSLDNVRSMFECFEFSDVQKVTIPSIPKVTTLENAFVNCYKLTEVNFTGTAPSLTNM